MVVAMIRREALADGFRGLAPMEALNDEANGPVERRLRDRLLGQLLGQLVPLRFVSPASI